MRNRDGWSSKGRFLKAEDHANIKGNEWTEILSMGTENGNVPLKNRRDQK